MLEKLIATALIPKFVYKSVINAQIKARLRDETKCFKSSHGQTKIALINSLKQSEIALSTDIANAQHYEVPTEFYKHILGPKMKYSCCLYEGNISLATAEDKMLELYCQRAGVIDGQEILDLGCGWGSFTLYAAKKYPNCKITSISNSATQKQYILQQADQLDLTNIEVITADINNLQLDTSFDLVISIEMFEHIRNYKTLFSNINHWLKDSGKLFVHYFCHQYLTYTFDTNNSWMAKHFFADGIMPSEDLLMFFKSNLQVENRWRVHGTHYAKTCYDWLHNLYHNKQEIMQIFATHYDNPKLMYQYWDLFIRACAQLFAFNGGNEWFVTHYLFKKSSCS